MATQTSVGVSLAVSSALPATYDATGFNALAFTTVGLLESVEGLVMRRNTGTFAKPPATRPSSRATAKRSPYRSCAPSMKATPDRR